MIVFSLEILDNVLSIMSKNSKNEWTVLEITTELYKNYTIRKNLNSVTIEKSIERLVLDGHIVEKTKKIKDAILGKYSYKYYEITQKGFFHIQANGYTNKHFDKNDRMLEKKNNEKRNQRLKIIATICVVVTVFVSLLPYFRKLFLFLVN